MTDYVMRLDCGHEEIFAGEQITVPGKWCTTCRRVREAQGIRRATVEDEATRENV